jgi:RimJ/RimL family protein N-acetyltransferase
MSRPSQLSRFALKARTLRALDVDLRPFELADVNETYQGWLLDEETVAYLDVGLTDRSMPALEAYIQAVHDDPNRYFWMIVERATGRDIGTASLVIETLHDNATYGYMIGERDHWGTGVAIQAQVAIFDFAFDILGARRFYGGAARENVMSQFNLKRLGFQKEGVFRQHVRVGADRRITDSVYYGLLAEDWSAVREKFNPMRYQDNHDV